MSLAAGRRGAKPPTPSADSEGRWPAKAGQRVPRSAAVRDHPSEGRGSEQGDSVFERSEKGAQAEGVGVDPGSKAA